MEEEFVGITAAVINKQIENVTGRLVGEVKEFWIKNAASFKKYVRAANTKYEKTKTLLYKDKGVLLSDIYVGTRLMQGADIIDENEFIRSFLLGNRCLISATAGSGKSFFSKWVFQKVLASKESIPLFVELRNLNNTELGIIDYLINDLKSNFKVHLSNDILIELISEGRFSLILDGYDELTNEKTKKINDELKSLEVPFADSAILITSRPGGENIEYLSGFAVYKVLRLDLSQAVLLVEKLNYDKVVKDSFLKALKKELFEKHSDFLSNPLLLTIMLMTYGDLAEIPSKMHIFYEQAFDTLFYRHDSSKGMYRRELKSGLAIDDFRDILSCVSASSYIRGQVSLTNTDLMTFIRKAKKTVNISSLSPPKYIDDLVQSVCIFLQDGGRYTYNHRSFQEYFAAYFLVQVPVDNKIEVYRRFLRKEDTDSALDLAFEMNQSMVEREFVRPMIKDILDQCDNPVKLMKSQMSGVDLHRREIRFKTAGKVKNKLQTPKCLVVNPTETWRFQVFVERMYEKKRKSFLSSKFLTNKAFEEEFGKCKVSKIIKMEDINDGNNLEILDRLGVTKISQRRLDFLNYLNDELDKRQSRTGSQEIEDWM